MDGSGMDCCLPIIQNSGGGKDILSATLCEENGAVEKCHSFMDFPVPYSSQLAWRSGSSEEQALWTFWLG